MTNPTEVEKLVAELGTASKNVGAARNSGCVGNLAGWEHRVIKQAAAMLEAQAAEIAGLRDAIAYHAEQTSTYIAQSTISEKNLASARWHNNKIRAAIATPEGEG